MSERPADLPPETAPPPGAEPTDEERVDEVGEESFPASDSPSWWSGPPRATQ